MKIEFKISKTDYFNYHYYKFKSDANSRKKLYLQWGVMSFLGFALSFIFYRAYGLNEITMVALVWTVATILFYPIYFKRECKRQILNFVKNTYKAEPYRTVSLEILEDELKTSSDMGEAKLKLGFFKQIVKTDENFFFIGDDGLGVILPKDEENFVKEFARKANLEIKEAKNV